MAPPARHLGRPWTFADREYLTLIVFSHGVQHMYLAVLPLTYSLVVEDFNINYGLLGVVLGVSGIIGGLLQGAAGLFEKVSARRLLAGQNLFLAGALAAGGLAPGIGLYGAARTFGAIASAPQHPVGSAALSRRFPERRGLVLSWHTVGGSIGTILVPVLASIIISTWGWREALLIFAVPLGLAGLLLAARLREGDDPEHQRQASTNRLPLAKVMLRRATIIILLSSIIAAGGRGLGVLNAYVPSYLNEGLGLGAITVGLVFSLMLAGSIIGPLAEGGFADRWGARPVAIGTYMFGAMSLVIFGLWGGQMGVLVVSAMLVGIFAYAETPLLQALFADAIQGAPSQSAFGLFFAIAYGVGSVWTIVMGQIIDAAGFDIAFLVMAASFVLAGAVLFFLDDSDQRPLQPVA